MLRPVFTGTKYRNIILLEGKMAYVISSDCISCGACEADCPVEAISQGDGKYEIDAETCIECGSCAATCPVEAISPQ